MPAITVDGLPAWSGAFVMDDRSDLVQAFEDYRAGRLGIIPV